MDSNDTRVEALADTVAGLVRTIEQLQQELHQQRNQNDQRQPAVLVEVSVPLPEEPRPQPPIVLEAVTVEDGTDNHIKKNNVGVEDDPPPTGVEDENYDSNNEGKVGCAPFEKLHGCNKRVLLLFGTIVALATTVVLSLSLSGGQGPTPSATIITATNGPTTLPSILDSTGTPLATLTPSATITTTTTTTTATASTPSPTMITTETNSFIISQMLADMQLASRIAALEAAIPDASGCAQGSPECRAIEWLAEQLLQEQQGNGNSSGGDDLQRYAMAVLYFATCGDVGVWTSSDRWLSDQAECDWRVMDCTNGNDPSSITRMDLSEWKAVTQSLVLRYITHWLRSAAYFLFLLFWILNSFFWRWNNTDTNNLTGTLPTVNAT